MLAADYKHLVPRKPSPVIGYMCSGCILITTLYKYFVLASLPWFVVQLGYIAIIGLALLWIFITGETSRIKTSAKMTVIYLLPYLFLLVYSMLVWLIQEGNLSNIRRGIVPIGYQMLQIIAIGAMCALLGTQAVKYTVIGLLAGNFLIVCSVLLNRGLGTGMSEMVSFFLHMGSVDNPTSKGLEVHDLTFAMGELVIYYIAFGQKEKNRWFFLCACFAFFILGWKRIALPGIVMVVLYVFRLRKKDENIGRKLTCAVGFAMTCAAFAFIAIIRTGLLEYITDKYGVNMMGRTQLYAFIEPRYQMTPTYIGHGIGYITELMREAIRTGTSVLNHEESIHSDILARYVELGFVGYLVWSLMYYLFTFRSIAQKFSVEAGLLFFSNLFYCYITYFTDNTVSYYHINLVLRLLPICYCLRSEDSIVSVLEERRKEQIRKWLTQAKSIN